MCQHHACRKTFSKKSQPDLHSYPYPVHSFIDPTTPTSPYQNKNFSSLHTSKLSRTIKTLQSSKATQQPQSQATMVGSRYLSQAIIIFNKQNSAWSRLYPRGSSGRADRQLVLGALLPGAWDQAGWTARHLAVGQHQERRLLQHLLLRDRQWTLCAPSGDGRSGALSHR